MIGSPTGADRRSRRPSRSALRMVSRWPRLAEGDKRRRLLFVGVGIVVAAVAGAVLTPALVGRLSDVTQGGPLERPDPHGWAMTQPVGFVFTDGVETLHLSGTEPATLTKVEATGTRSLKVVGVALVRPGRKVGTIQEMDGWPPRDRDLRPADVIRPGIGAMFTPTSSNPRQQSYELLVGMKVVKAGYLVRDGFRITYEVDGRPYRQTFPAQLAVCTSASFERGGDCPFPDERRGEVDVIPIRTYDDRGG